MKIPAPIHRASMSFELFIGRRYLRTKQKQAFISLITLLSIAGVMVGVMALIVVIAVMAGFESDLKSRILGVESHVVATRPEAPFTDYEDVLTAVKDFEGVVSADPYVYSQVMLRSSAGVSGAVLRGIDPASADRVIRNIDGAALHQLSAPEGSNGKEASGPGIILGRELANGLGVLEGDRVYLITSRGMISPIGHMPAMKRFQVAGYFESGMYEYDGSLAFVRLQDAQQALRMGDAVTGIEIRVEDVYAARRIADRISEAVGSSYEVRDWMEMNRNFFSALKLEKTVMFIILTLIVLVAAFNIAGSLIMMVMEKTRDIAILKTMGAADRSIRRIFMFKGAAVGGIGTLLGAGLGCLLCFLLKRYRFIQLPSDVYYITTLPVQLELWDVMLIAAAALGISFLATLYPAYQASRLNPVEALRYG